MIVDVLIKENKMIIDFEDEKELDDFVKVIDRAGYKIKRDVLVKEEAP